MLGFIYKWTDKKTGLMYIGRHEGDPIDTYIGSGTIFISEYNKRPQDFEREILWSDALSIDELVLKEEEYLNQIQDDEFYYGKNRKYYNQVRNASGYTSLNNPMKNREVVERMLKTREDKGTHKSPWERTVAKYGYEEACAIQSRSKLGNTYGVGNKGKPKTEEHKKNIAKSHKGGRPLVNIEETMRIFNQHGLKKGAVVAGVTYETFKARVLVSKKRLTSNK